MDMAFKKLCLFITVAFTFLPFALFAQQLNLPLNRFYLLEVEKHLALPGNPAHTALKPYLESAINYDSIQMEEAGIQSQKLYSSWLMRKVKHESLIVVDTGDFQLFIDPLFNFSFSNDRFDQSLRADTTRFYNNTRGVRAMGNIGRKFSFETTFYENQSFFVQYLDSFVRQWGVVPGQGRVKDFKRTGYDYAFATGYISFSPLRQWNLQFGHGRQFIGDGYRSLLLSDNAFVYPYLKSTLSLFNQRIVYSNTFSSLQTLRRMRTAAQREELFVRKAGTFHYLGLNLHPRLQLGLFEGVIWRNSDGNYTQPLNPMFYNPLIFLNTAAFGADTVNHVLNGLNLKLKILNKAFLYGQYAVGRLDFSRYGYQIGFRWFDFLGLKNFHIQAEYNHVEPFLYSFSNAIQNYGHNNQPLAHPLMADFNEAIFFVNYRLRDIFVEIRGSLAMVNRDASRVNTGNNIFVNEPAMLIGGQRGMQSEITWGEANLGYMINRKTNMAIRMGYGQRILETEQGLQKAGILTIALSTALFNRYYDF
jgi:hypothetical protein